LHSSDHTVVIPPTEPGDLAAADTNGQAGQRFESNRKDLLAPTPKLLIESSAPVGLGRKHPEREGLLRSVSEKHVRLHGAQVVHGATTSVTFYRGDESPESRPVAQDELSRNEQHRQTGIHWQRPQEWP
jgi:hypothetical protein